MVMVVTLLGCETKVTQISVVCRPAARPTEAVRWFYANKVDPSVVIQLAPAIDVTLRYTGADPRVAPPVTTYFYRKEGATLRVASSSKASIPPKGLFTYHVDTGGYVHGLATSGRGEPDELALLIEVDGSYFGAVLSPATCLRSADRHLEIVTASGVPNLEGKHPLNIAAADWLGISPRPPVVLRLEEAQVSTYAFFAGPTDLTATENETSVPDDVAKQTAEVGVTATTPTFSITKPAIPEAAITPGAAKGG
jgi:hypothetical protein